MDGTGAVWGRCMDGIERCEARRRADLFFGYEISFKIQGKTHNKSVRSPPPHRPSPAPVVRHLPFSKLATLTGRCLIEFRESFLCIITYRCVFPGNQHFWVYFPHLRGLLGILFWHKRVLLSSPSPTHFLQVLLAKVWAAIAFVCRGGIHPVRFYPGGSFCPSGVFVVRRMLIQTHLFSDVFFGKLGTYISSLNPPCIVRKILYSI